MAHPRRKENTKELISANLKFLMEIYGKSRREVCEDLDISYTTFCDWYNGKTYPKIESLESLAYYFRIETGYFFINLEKSKDLHFRLIAYARELGVRLNKERILNDNPEAVQRMSHFVTNEEFSKLPEGYPAELLRGQIRLLASPSLTHQRIVMRLSAEIYRYISAKNGKCEVIPGPFDVVLPVKEDSTVVPDITVVCNLDLLQKEKCIGAPDWIIEVLSETNKRRDLREKLSLYEEAGVKEYWIVNPYKYETLVYVLEPNTEEGFEDQLCYLEGNHYKFEEEIPVSIYDNYKVCLASLLEK